MSTRQSIFSMDKTQENDQIKTKDKKNQIQFDWLLRKKKICQLQKKKKKDSRAI